MSKTMVDHIGEHTAGEGITFDNTVRGSGFIMQPDELDVDMTVPVGSTLYVKDTLVVAAGKTLTVNGTVIVE